MRLWMVGTAPRLVRWLVIGGLSLAVAGFGMPAQALPAAAPGATLSSSGAQDGVGAASRIDPAAVRRAGTATQPARAQPRLDAHLASWQTTAATPTSAYNTTSQMAGTSSNWSGYIVGAGPYTSVSGTFSVPNLAATPTQTVAAEWVGIDGAAKDGPLIQAGATETYDPATHLVYTNAWWEILPAPSTLIPSLRVVPGDSVTVTIAQVGGTLWAISVTDTTTGGQFTTQQTYSGPQSTAEWIVEAPTSGSGTQDTLGEYSPAVAFSGLRMQGSETTLTAVTMVQGGVALSAPSVLGTTGFRVSYIGPIAPLPSPTPAATPAPTPGPSLQVYTITLGQQFALRLSGGSPYLQAQWQQSADRTTWTPLVAVTLDAFGASTYTFAPPQTAYYRTYFPSLAQYGSWVVEVVVTQPATPSPTPTPTVTPSPVPVSSPSPGAAPNAPTIFTVTSGESTSLSQAGPVTTSFQLETSTDGTTWTTLATLTTDSSGHATYSFTPTATAYYRSVFPGSLPSDPVLGVVLPALSTSISVDTSASAITWATGVMLSVHVMNARANVAGRTVRLIASRDAITWSTIGTLTTDASGTASMRYRPATNLWYRAVFDGATDLPAETSASARVVVRQIAILRPTNAGAVKTVAPDSVVQFTTTVRPARPELTPAKVTYVFYHYSAGHWTLVARRDGYANAASQVSLDWHFSLPGAWYVRSIADPTPDNANSVWSAVERYDVL